MLNAIAGSKGFVAKGAACVMAIALFAGGIVFINQAFAAVTIPPATGGTNIAADKAVNGSSPAFTVLGNIVITEGVNTDFPENVTNATLILTAPSNWQFNAGVGAVAVTPVSNDFTAQSITVSTSTVTITFSTDNNANKLDVLTISGIEVQAIDGSVLPASGNILRASANPGTATIAGIVNDSTDFGALSQADVTPPTVVLSSGVSDPTNSSPIPVTATFSETVTGFADTDIVAGNGVVSNFVPVSGTIYTFDVTPSGQGSVTVDVAAGVAEDAATNLNTAATQLVRTYDSVAPVISETTPVAALGNDNTPDYTFSSDSAGTISYGGDCSSAFNPASAGANTLTFNALADGAHSNCTVTVTDAAGNASNVLAVTAFTVDATAPTIALTSGTSDPTNSLPIPVTATFSEDVTGFAVGDIAVGNGAAGNFVSVSGSVYTFDVTPAGQGSVTVDVAGSVAQDAAANNNTAAIQLARVYDSIAPIISELTAVPAVTSDNTPDYTFTSDEAGTISYGGTCSSVTTSGAVGSNTVTFATLADGAHAACTVTVTDAAGNASNILPVTAFLVDTTAPSVNAGTDKIVNALVNQDATVSDGGSGIATYQWAQDSGPGTITFGSATAEDTTLSADTEGVYVVSLTVTDTIGNFASDTITFTWDVTAPVIAVHGNELAEATSAAGAAVTYTSPATTDAVDGAGTATCVAASGSTFPLGTTAVDCDATDAAGNAAVQTSFNVEVVDTTAPVIAAHADVTAEATSPAGAVVVYTSPATTDAVDGPGTATCLPASGTTFAFGTTPVACDATDGAGNPAIQTTFNVIVQDTTPPVITLVGADPQVIEVFSAYVELGATVSDNYDTGLSATINASAVNTAIVGTYQVTYDVTDANSNAATQVIRTVNVVDTTPPVIAAHADITGVEATSGAGAVVAYTVPAATDNYDPSVTVTCAPVSGSTFPLGTTTVDCDATDANGNAATTVSFDVEVVDTTAPLITLTGSATVDLLIGDVYLDAGATASDIVDGDVSGSVIMTPTPGPVSTATTGTFTLEYNVSDGAGNPATPVTRTVNVRATITASAGVDGTITPSGAVIVNGGASQAFTITAGAGALVTEIIVDGVAVGLSATPSETYTFTNVTADHTIEGVFGPDTRSAADVTISGFGAGGNGIGTGGGQVLGASTTGTSTVSGPSEGQVLGASTFQFTMNLRRGMRNNDVMELQKALKQLGFFTMEPTGYFGPATLAAVKAYQKAYNLPQTGFFGPMTRASLNKVLAG